MIVGIDLGTTFSLVAVMRDAGPVVLPNAVDPRIFNPRRDGARVRARHELDGAFVVGFSGTLKPWHGLTHLLEALAQVRPTVPHARLIVRTLLQVLAERVGAITVLAAKENIEREAAYTRMNGYESLVVRFSPP